jgi:hypothetical protein
MDCAYHLNQVSHGKLTHAGTAEDETNILYSTLLRHRGSKRKKEADTIEAKSNDKQTSTLTF